MKRYQIENLSDILLGEINHKIDNKTKPVGALGVLEDIARRICVIQNTLYPELKNPAVIVFAGDHGIAKEGEVNPYPQEVTYQMVMNFLSGGAAINVFCNQHHIDLSVVDAGVNYNFKGMPGLVHAKIAYGTNNYKYEPAMSVVDCEMAMEVGVNLVESRARLGTNIIAFGEMGIGNTSSASLILSAISGFSIEECVGKGTGLNQEGLERKKKVLVEVLNKYKFDINTNPLEIIAAFGGFEIAMMCGAYIAAASNRMIILVDGFISTAALMVAFKLYPEVLSYCLFSHVSDEYGHQKMLDYLNVKPIVNFNMRLGEGTGAAIVYPLVESAVLFMNQMASFESAKVSKDNNC